MADLRVIVGFIWFCNRNEFVQEKVGGLCGLADKAKAD